MSRFVQKVCCVCVCVCLCVCVCVCVYVCLNKNEFKIFYCFVTTSFLSF